MRNVSIKSIYNILSVSSIECFEQLSKISNSHLIDVRTKPEWLYVGIPNLQSLQKKTLFISWQTYPSMKINSNFKKEILNSKIDKNDNIFLICRSGQRSLQAATYLTSFGFTKCRNVIDGFEGIHDKYLQRSTVNGWKYNLLPWKQ